MVGFDGRSQQALAAKGIQTTDGWALMLEATRTKTVDEINCLKMAFAVTDGAWYRTWEALRPGALDTAVSVAALTIYDMLKALDKGMVIDEICLLEKRGGRSGHYVRT